MTARFARNDGCGMTGCAVVLPVRALSLGPVRPGVRHVFVRPTRPGAVLAVWLDQ
jgi:hypothetical protein